MKTNGSLGGSRAYLLAVCTASAVVAMPIDAGATLLQEGAATDNKDDVASQVVGILVDKAGKAVAGTTVSLLMVTSENQALPFPLFTPESKTDAQGRFTLKLPNSMLSPEGVQVVGFAVGFEQWSEKDRKTIAKALKAQATQKFPVVNLVPKSKTTDIGKIVLEP